MDIQNKREAAKALIGMYFRQTTDEIITHATVHSNAIGFNAVDAGVLTSISQWLLDGKPFTDKQHSLVVTLLNKYTSQISEIDLNKIDVPETCFTPKPKQPEQLTGDGLLKIEGEEVVFFPNVYPSSQVKGTFRWDKSKGRKGAWVSKLNLGAINLVKRLFPDVVIDSTITSYIDRSQYLVSLPDGLSESPLMKFQKEGTQFLLTSRRSMLAFAPGLGKTITSIFAANEIGGIVLVICPKTLMFNWRNEIHKWLGESTPVAIWYGPPEKWERKKPVEGRLWIITNHETAVRQFVVKKEKMVRGKKEAYYEPRIKINASTLILDESVLYKNRKANRSRAMKPLANIAPNVYLLSGSPTTRFYDDMWAQLNILDPKRFSSYWKFAEMYCVVVRDEWGTKIVANKPGADQMLQQDLADIYMARTQDQVLDLPPWIIDDVHVPMSDRQFKPYKEMEDKFKAMIPEGDEVVAFNVLAQLTRLVQMASNTSLLGGAYLGAKWDATVEMLEYEKLPAIIWTTFIETANSLQKRIQKAGYSTAVLTSETSTEKRQEYVDSFQAGSIDVIIAHPGVGKFGLTLTAAHTAIYTERSYNGDDYYQSLHRIRRIGTKESPHVVHLIADSPNGGSTVDWVISRVLKFRKDSAIKLTSGLLREGFNEHV
jgi:hypothetical protein